MKALFASILALSATFAACAQSGTTTDCGDKENCNNVCVDLKSDKENCGACGAACPGAQVCAGGKCTQQCPNGGLLCNNGCVNAKFDNTNCGACGKTCKPGEVCSQGTCGSTCQGVATCTPEGGGQAYCADTKNDNKNCGKCGTQCMPGEACINGTCNGACTMTQTLCSPEAGMPYCANLDSDNDNCGDCGKKCGTLEACNGGICVPGCAPFQTMCKPDGGKPYCVDAQTDNANCGACGNVCPLNKPICVGGACSNQGSNPATCNELLAKPTVWNLACTGLDLRKRTKSTFHFLGCIDSESCTFYCTYDAQTQTLLFGTKGSAALRAQVDPGNAAGDNFAVGAYQCCSANAPTSVCNAPESKNNNVNIVGGGIKALCNALGYQQGSIVREQNNNSCPQAHSKDTTGQDWTSDWQSDAAGGLEYKCSVFQ